MKQLTPIRCALTTQPAATLGGDSGSPVDVTPPEQAITPAACTQSASTRSTYGAQSSASVVTKAISFDASPAAAIDVAQTLRLVKTLINEGVLSTHDSRRRSDVDSVRSLYAYKSTPARQLPTPINCTLSGGSDSPADVMPPEQVNSPAHATAETARVHELETCCADEAARANAAEAAVAVLKQQVASM